MFLLAHISDFQKIAENLSVRSVKLFLSKYPAFPVLASVLTSVLPAAVFPSCRWLPMLLPVLWTCAGWCLFGVRRALFQFAVPSLAGLCALFLNEEFRQKDDLTEMLGSRPAGIEAEIVVCDPSYYNDGNVSPSSRPLLCRMEKIRFSPSDRWQGVDSRIIAIFPPGTEISGYGARFAVDGALESPDPPLPGTGFDYSDYLYRRGIHFVLQIGKARPAGVRPSCFRRLLRVRDRLLDSLTAPLKRPELKALASALLFGCRRGVSRESRTAFIESGTIHVLTVSGLHIGMFAAAVFLLLLPVPFRLRMVLAPVLTLVYAFSTGMQMPAVRAVVMLFCWCIPRAFLVRSSGLNSVLLAGALLLLWNPGQLKDAGFQYSFACVITLLVTASGTSSWLSLAAERLHWIPEKLVSQWTRKGIQILIRTASGVTGCLAAWLCSFALTVCYQGLTIPFAMAANLLILPAVYAVFLVFAFALVPCLLFPAAGTIFSILLTGPLEMIEAVCRSFAAWSGPDSHVPPAPFWTVPCALLSLWLLFGFPGRKAGTAGLCALIVLMFVWCSGLLPPRDAGMEILLLHGGRQEVPGIVISCPAKDFSAAVNLSDFRNVLAAADFLKRRGHTELSLLVCSRTGKNYAGALRYFPGRMKVLQILTVKPAARSAVLKEGIRSAAERRIPLIIQPGPVLKWSRGGRKIETILKNEEFSFDISEKENKVHIRMVPDASAGMKVLIIRDGIVRHRLRLPRELHSRAVRVELNDERRQRK